MYIEYYDGNGLIKSLGDGELIHYNHNHDALGRFAGSKGGSSPQQRLNTIAKKQQSIDRKTQSLKTREAKYRAKSAKYSRKANKVRRLAANPLIGKTDFSRGANYASLRYEGKGLKYSHKAAVANKKINKLDKKYTKLGEERVQILQEKYDLKLDKDRKLSK